MTLPKTSDQLEAKDRAAILKMVRIVYVERSPGPFKSIEKVFREIAKHLPERFVFEFQQLPYSWRVYDSFRNLLFFRRREADIYHITGHAHFIALRLPPQRTVLSIMDVRFVVLNRGIKRWVLKKLYLDLPLSRMKYVTAISAKVKDEIVELTGCDPGKIKVLDIPLLSHFNSDLQHPFEADNPTVLQIGTMENKNVVRLAAALRGICCKLVVVGELSAEQLDALDENKIEFENYVDISDEKIRELYERADLVTFCSTYEGFGLPIIEAQAMNKPLVTSDISPLKDVAGDCACLVDPFSIESIRAGIVGLIESADQRRAVVEAGQRNAVRFSPASVSAQYASLYDEIQRSLR